MFFQKSNTPRSVLQKALFSVFVFWGTSLFGLSMYYNWVEGTILNIPMILLATGLVVYFVTIALFNWVGERS